MFLLLQPNVFTRTAAVAWSKSIDNAITQLNGYRGDIGSQNQVESAVRNLDSIYKYQSNGSL